MCRNLARSVGDAAYFRRIALCPVPKVVALMPPYQKQCSASEGLAMSRLEQLKRTGRFSLKGTPRPP